MSQQVRYQREGPVAKVTMDDGKVNALSLDLLTQLDDAFSRAEADEAVVVLSGRSGVFSAGFDLDTLRVGGTDAAAMVRAGFELAERILSFPAPVVISCTGHAVAMGVFLVLSGDYRVGADGPYKITANEVAIGLTMPGAAIEICRQRLSPAHFNRATITAEVFAPHAAVDAGFLDLVVAEAEMDDEVSEVAARLANLDRAAHAATKLRARNTALEAIRDAIQRESQSYAALAG